MWRKSGPCALFLILGFATRASAQTSLLMPRVEFGGQVVAAVRGSNGVRSAGPRVTVNLTSRTAIEVMADIDHPYLRYGEGRDSTFVYVQLKQTLYRFRGSAVSGLLGATFVRLRDTFPASPYHPSYTYPTRSDGGFIAGIGVDRRLAGYVSLRAEAEFVATYEDPELRTAVGVTVPIGRYHDTPAPTSAAAAAWAPITGRHPLLGRTVWITSADGHETTGEVTSILPSSIEVSRGDGRESVALADVRKIEVPDSIVDGTVRGIWIGAISGGGLVVLAASAACGSEDNCGFGNIAAVTLGMAGIGAGVGAVIGAIADSLRVGRQTIYDAKKVTFSPVVVKRGGGIGAMLRW